MYKDSKIMIAGASGLVGSAIFEILLKEGYQDILRPNREELDLKCQSEVKEYFFENKPEYVFLAAAKVGGIKANNDLKAEFIYDNIIIQSNIIHNAYLFGVKKLLFLGSSCIYPKEAPQPIKEEHLLSGYLEKTNEPYAIAKISGIKLCESYNKQYGCNFISVMPSNLYGPNDNFDLDSAHALPALLHKVHLAKKNNLKAVEVWGTGKPRREFLYVSDLAEACLMLMKHKTLKYDCYNIGVGSDIAIEDLIKIIFDVVGYEGEYFFDSSKPDGTFRKLLEISKITSLGWEAKTSLKQGIAEVYKKVFL